LVKRKKMRNSLVLITEKVRMQKEKKTIAARETEASSVSPRCPIATTLANPGISSRIKVIICHVFLNKKNKIKKERKEKEREKNNETGEKVKDKAKSGKARREEKSKKQETEPQAMRAKKAFSQSAKPWDGQIHQGGRGRGWIVKDSQLIG